MRKVAALSLLRRQILRQLKEMSWDAGFRTSKRNSEKFSIRVGKRKIATVTVEQGYYAIWCSISLVEQIKTNRFANCPDTLRWHTGPFKLSRTRSAKPWFCSVLKQLKRICVEHVMGL